MARRLEEMVPADRGRGMDQRSDVLELIAEAEGPAGLVVAGPSPEPARQHLVEQPTVEHQVERRIRRAHGDGAEQGVPVLLEVTPRRLDRGALAVPGEEVQGLVSPGGLPEHEMHVRRRPGGQIEVDLQRGAGIEAGPYGAGKPDPSHRGRRCVTPVAAQELRPVGRQAVELLARRHEGDAVREVLVPWIPGE